MQARIAAAVLAAFAVVVSQLATAAPAEAKKPAGDPPIQFVRANLSDGDRAGVAAGAPLTLAAGGLTSGSYDDLFDNPDQGPIAYQSGSWISDWTASFAYDELVASWNATTPAGTWIRIEKQGQGSGRTTKWYTLQVWASGDGDIHRTSVPLQGDGDGFIAIDTFIRSKKAAPLDQYRIRITLYRKATSSASPSVRFVGAMTSAAASYQIPSPFNGSESNVLVPELSQETHVGHFPEYDNGGEAWCSPTSTAMVLRRWSSGPSTADLIAFPGYEADGETLHPNGEVDHAARYVYDWNYQGAGNWPNNTAYAATFGLNGFVTRLRSLNEAQLFTEMGIPLVASINGKLPGFKTNGHLLVIRGFDVNGDVITNDPAVVANDDAEKTYGREDFENVWLGGSGGIVYVIYPQGQRLPDNVPGLPANW